MMEIFVDADLILEALLNRSLYVADAEDAFELLLTQSIQGYISEMGFQRIYWIASSLGGLEAAEEIATDIKERVKIYPIDSLILQEARSLTVADFESAVEIACANKLKIAAILTHNPQVFSGSAVPIRLFKSVDDLYICQGLECLLRKPVRLSNWLHNNFAEANRVGWQKFEDIFAGQQLSYRYIRKNRKSVKAKRAKTIDLDDGLQVGLGLHLAEYLPENPHNLVNILVHLNVIGGGRDLLT